MSFFWVAGSSERDMLLAARHTGRRETDKGKQRSDAVWTDTITDRLAPECCSTARFGCTCQTARFGGAGGIYSCSGDPRANAPQRTRCSPKHKLGKG